MKRNSNSIGPEVRKGLTEEEINSPEFNADDFAPAPDAGVTVGINEEKKNKKNAVAFALVAAVLALMIGLLGWGISAGIDDYYENITKNEVLSVFPNCNKIEKLEINNRDFEVYVVFFKERIAGYCVLGTAEGFGGPIRFAVAFNSEDHISKVSVLEHNESKGLGAKIAGEKFLSAFVGLIAGDDEFKLAKKDLIAGATTSYTAMEESIQKVLALGITTESIAVELGFETITEEEIEEEVRKEEEEKENNKSDEDDDEKNPSKDNDSNSEPVDTDGNGKPGVGDNVGGTNVNIGDEETDDDLNGKDEDTVYDSETEETEEPEETTGEPEDSKEPDETTGKPEDSETSKPNPDTSKEPETSKPRPDTSKEPETSAPEPDTSKEPETSKDPETSAPEPDTSDSEADTTVPVEPDTSIPEDSDTSEPDTEDTEDDTTAPVSPDTTTPEESDTTGFDTTVPEPESSETVADSTAPVPEDSTAPTDSDISEVTEAFDVVNEEELAYPECNEASAVNDDLNREGGEL